MIWSKHTTIPIIQDINHALTLQEVKVISDNDCYMITYSIIHLNIYINNNNNEGRSRKTILNINIILTLQYKNLSSDRLKQTLSSQVCFKLNETRFESTLSGPIFNLCILFYRDSEDVGRLHEIVDCQSADISPFYIFLTSFYFT